MYYNVAKVSWRVNPTLPSRSGLVGLYISNRCVYRFIVSNSLVSRRLEVLNTVKLLRASPNAKIPTKGTAGSAYYDLYAAEHIYLIANRIALVSTGWRIEVPVDWFLDVRPRSGLASKGITVNNSPGTVDADYRGELKVILINLSGESFVVNIGDRIAQCALMPIVEADFIEVDYGQLSETARGVNGYGSTGK